MMPLFLPPLALRVDVTGTWPAYLSGFRVYHYPELDSTNDTALDLAKGCVEASVIIADYQRAGRGRGHNIWESPAGNVCLSLLLPPQYTLTKSLWPLQAGINVVQALRPLINRPLRLKWPNDIMLGDAKVGGILVDIAPQSGALVVGIGLNVQQAPAACLRQPTAALAEAALMPLTARGIIEQLLAHWRIASTPIIETWLAHAYGLGQPVSLDYLDTRLAGVFEGVSSDGALRLRLRDGQILDIADAKNLTFINKMSYTTPCI